ncbi:MAG: DNA polymerase III subunit delta [Candidatus Izemoplasmatales bacterium]|jgi:DNA polymerase-3 subunit delta|nr:DNA polymerase III subunit delta [Candidatus Izemoplasmatales bacterium]MDD3865377.1 DNA polymerase III subunit delta [Candidatus Izemoplasmatales bacterium]
MNGNLYLLFGTDTYLLKKRTDKCFSDYGVGAEDIEVFDMEEVSVEVAINAAMTIPFLSEKKGVILKNCHFLSATKAPKEANYSLAYLYRYLRNPNPTTMMILQAPYEKLDTRKQVYKVCEETCVFEECVPVEKMEMYGMIKKILNQSDKTIEPNALEEFVNRTKDSTYLALNELNKLIAYIGDQKIIDLPTVWKVTTRDVEDNIYELVNAILAKDTRSITNIYRDLAEVNTEPTIIIKMVADKFQEILYTKELFRTNRTYDDVMRYFNASKGRTYYIVKNAREISDELLKKYMEALEEVDYRIKSGTIDKKIGVELFLLGI